MNYITTQNIIYLFKKYIYLISLSDYIIYIYLKKKNFLKYIYFVVIYIDIYIF